MLVLVLPTCSFSPKTIRQELRWRETGSLEMRRRIALSPVS